MENGACFGGDEPMELPPGFRFYPTDEELITHYLTYKVLDSTFSATPIGEVDLNKCEPWELPKRAKMGEDSWYFFCVRDRKYPTGLRTNRATDAGYWKATGKDKEIFRGKSLVGMKKTLVFYKGRAPKGDKSNWVMHEYRLEGEIPPRSLPSSSSKNEWVICRVFHKNAGGKKDDYQGLTLSNSFGSEFINPIGLPPLMDTSPYNKQLKVAMPGSSHVPCFSNPPFYDGFNITNISPFYSKNRMNVSGAGNSMIGSGFGGNSMPEQGERGILETNYGSAMKQRMKAERDMVSVSQDTCLTSDMNNAEISSNSQNHKMGRGHEGPSASGGPVDIELFWNY